MVEGRIYCGAFGALASALQLLLEVTGDRFQQG